LRGYIVRARRLRRAETDPARQADLDRLISDLASQRASPRLTRERNRVRALERRLFEAEATR
jgi:hypothetical protein